MATLIPLPDDFKPASPSATTQSNIVPLPDSFQPVGSTAIAPTVAPAQTHATQTPSGDMKSDAWNFLRTAATKAAAGIAGTPAALQDFLEARDKASGHPRFTEGGKPFPTTSGTEDFLFKHTAPEYKPESTLGQYGMTGATYALPALIGAPEAMLPNAVRGFAGGVAAEHAERNGLPAWAGPIATALTEFLARRGAHTAFSPHTRGGQERVAGQILNETTPIDHSGASAPFPGMQLTTGQMTGDQNMLALDRKMTGANADSQLASNGQAAGNRAIVRDQLNNISSGPGGLDASVTHGAAVTDAAHTAKQAENTAWNNINPAIVSNTAPLKTALEAHITGLDAGDRRFLPHADIQAVRDLPDNASLRDLQSIRRNMVTDARDAGKAFRSNDQRVINDTAAVITNHLDDAAHLRNGSAADLADYEAAKQATRDYHANFGSGRNQNPLAAKVVSGQTDASKALGQSLPRGAGGPEGLRRLKMAAGGNLDPARDYIVSQLKTAVDEGPEAFGKVMSDYSYALRDRDMFTAAQHRTMQDAQAAVEQIHRTAEPGAKLASQTYAGLTGDSVARTLYGNILGRVAPVAAKISGAAIASKAANAFGAGPIVGEVVGPMMGKEAGEGWLNSKMHGAQRQILEIVDQARRDPALARELQMRASAGNMRVAPRTRAMLKTLGISAGLALPNSASE